jgi:hypothetical protein
MRTDYAKFINSSPFMSLKYLFQKCVESISNNDSKQLIDVIISKLPQSLRNATIINQSIPYYRGDNDMQISVYYNEKGKTLQEIIEQLFEEYCVNL